MEVHSELGVLRKKDQGEVEAIIGCTVRSCLKTSTKTVTLSEWLYHFTAPTSPVSHQ